MRAVKLALGLVLLPACLGAIKAVGLMLSAVYAGVGHALPVAYWGFFAGFALWCLLFFIMPRPTRAYVLGHELTHALWAWLMGARVSGLHVSDQGGSVKVSKTNVLITLAPYFFPLYTGLVLLAYGLTAIFLDTSDYTPFWLGLIGLTWAFHVTFTIDMLRRQQPDIREHGRLFSYILIVLFNTLGVGLWITLISTSTVDTYLETLVREISTAYLRIGTVMNWALNLIRAICDRGWPG